MTQYYLDGSSHQRQFRPTVGAAPYLSVLFSIIACHAAASITLEVR